ncbi:hypothetical protein LAG90_06845 [Marinilongibacter aquaticus]|uniref:hypothetical protein n=1 Tax=Marinilongibacter aquaticus TaxID=2975157 RepID=UPI0021BD89A3|nr:hypothetical protein [Marinilongibacter aquaticus]UBM60361.1 hypothetical protein LAG90_06845 [Marinilongibacter aquaticus]
MKNANGSRAVFNGLLIVISLMLILGFKWFFVHCDMMLNGDEAYVYANALSLVKLDPIPYRTVDFGTLGPVHAFFFILPQLLGFEISYSGVRVVWLIVWFASQFFLFRAYANFFRLRDYFYAIFYAFMLASTSLIYDFNFFNNESTSMLFLALGLFFLSKNYGVDEHRNRFDFWAVFFLSIAPFAKLHAGLLAVVLVLFVFAQKFRSKGVVDYRYVLQFLLAGLVFPLVFGAYLLYFGQLEHFFFFYIQTNLEYGSMAPFWERFFNTFVVRSTSEHFLNYYVKHFYLLLLLLSLLFVLFKKLDFRSLLFVVCGLVSVVSISLPGNYYGHYFTYLLLTFGLGIATVGLTIQTFSPRVYRIWKVGIVVLSSVFMFWAIKGHAEMYSSRTCEPNPSALAEALITLRKDKKLESPKMAIFDWRNDVYIETGFWPCTHYSMPERLLGHQAKNPEVVSEARKIYLQDLETEKPEFFVLATSTKYSYWDMTEKALRTLPRIHKYVMENYRLVEEVDDAKIYLRKDVF